MGSAVKNQVTLVGQELFRKISREKKPFLCLICDKHFSQKHLVKSHIRSHTGEKPFTCSICNRSFSDRCNLTNHLRNCHLDQKQENKCSICNKSFSMKSTLNRHHITHTGEKPHWCSLCHESFSQKTSLQKHLLYHSRETFASTQYKISNLFSVQNIILAEE